jgi:hypothetical protein
MSGRCNMDLRKRAEDAQGRLHLGTGGRRLCRRRLPKLLWMRNMVGSHNCITRSAARPTSHAIWLRLIDRRALRQNHPRLLVPRIEVCRRLEPRCVVKCAASNDARVARGSVPIFIPPQRHIPQSGHTQRVLARPSSVTPPGADCNSFPVSRNASPGTATPIENALAVARWQSVQWHV